MIYDYTIARDSCTRPRQRKMSQDRRSTLQKQILSACEVGDLETVRRLCREIDPHSIKDDATGETPLHKAARCGHLNIVEFLIQEANCDSNTLANDGLSPLHNACRFGHLNIVKFLINETNCDPNRRDIDGYTPLHTACRSDRENVMEFLLVEAHCDPNITTNDGSTPLSLTYSTPIIRLLLQHGAIAHNLYDYLSLLPDGAPRKPAQSTVSLFTLGDKGAGKSTLVKALATKKASIIRWMGRLSKVSGVKERTAGIASHTVHDDRLGHLSIYDAAGHREFHNSNDTVIRSSMLCQSMGMFLLVINLAGHIVDLKGAVSYWLSFIQSLVSSESSEPVAKPYLIAVGSHANSVESRQELEEKESIIRSMCRDAESINFVDYVRVDCRYSESPALTKLRARILATHDKLQERIPAVTFRDHCFHVYLVSECGSKPGLQLGNLMTTIQADPLSMKERFLPPTIQALHEACSNLSKRGVMLYIQTQSIESSWIIIDKDALLREVNGTIFAPGYFMEHKSLTQTGVVPFSKIESSFPQFDPQLIVDFLVHMEFCREIREEDLLKLVTEAHTEYSRERHFLFPSLTQQRPPPDIWQPPSDQYSCCWVLRCRDGHYLSPRFKQVLLLRLAFEHSDAVESSTSPVLHQQCSIWQTTTSSDVVVNGIKWLTDSSDVMVEITDTRVALFLSCSSWNSMKNKQLELAATRSQVIGQILKAKAEFCGINTKTVEEFVPDPQYPVTIPCTTAISVQAIAKAICEGKENVLVSEQDRVTLAKLLHFEPYQFFCSLQCLVDLYSEHSVSSVPIIQPVSSKIDDFCNLLSNPLQKVVSENSSSDLVKAARMIQSAAQSKTTNQSLRELMDKYSIFSGRNILEIANVSPDSLPPPSLPPTSPPPTLPLATPPPSILSSESNIYLEVFQSKPAIAQLRSMWSSSELITIIRTVAPWWRRVGRSLNIPKEILDNIRGDNEICCETMFQLWLDGAVGKEVTWAGLMEALDRARFFELAKDIKNCLLTQPRYPVIEGADIIARRTLTVSPEKPLDFHWKGHGFKMYSPAGAISKDPVTLHIQASLAGKYQLPGDKVFVSGIYWLSTDPPVKRFNEKITISLQHCAANDDAVLSFVTAKCTQKSLPYNFKPLQGGSFSEPWNATIDVEHFSSVATVAKTKSESGQPLVLGYTVRSFFIPIQQRRNMYNVHITVTQRHDLVKENVTKIYRTESAEDGPSLSMVKFNDGSTSIEMDTSDESWTNRKDGWELKILAFPSLLKEDLDSYEGKPPVPAFQIELKMTKPMSLEQKVKFKGILPGDSFILLTREPPEHEVTVPSSSSTTMSTHRDTANVKEPPTLPKLLRLRIPEGVGANYTMFGTFLLNDETGSEVEAIEKQYKSDATKIIISILRKWLDGKGEPLSWGTLVETLEDTGLIALAKKVKDKHCTPP